MTGLFEEHLPSPGVYLSGALGKALRDAVLATSPSDEALPGRKLEAKTTVSGSYKFSWPESQCNYLPRHKTTITNQANDIDVGDCMLIITYYARAEYKYMEIVFCSCLYGHKSRIC